RASLEAVYPLVVTRVALQERVHQIGSTEACQEVVDRHPLIMPARDPPGVREALPLIHPRVVEADDCEVELQDDDVLVVAEVADDCGSLTVGGRRAEPIRAHVPVAW